MNRTYVSLLMLSIAIVLPGCGGDNTVPDSPTETANTLSPEETVARLIELAKTGDWETYVDDYYGESHKFEGLAERREAVIARFRDKWATDVLEGLEALDEGKATISDDGKKAVFMKDGVPSFNLFLSDDGRWTFHL